jgi:DNA-binding response OmpR family regulator
VEVICKNPEFPWIVAVDTTGDGSRDNQFLYSNMLSLPDFNFNLAIVREGEFSGTIADKFKPETIFLNTNNNGVKISDLKAIAPVIVLTSLRYLLKNDHIADLADPITAYSEKGAYLIRDNNCPPEILAADAKSIHRKKLAEDNNGAPTQTLSPNEIESQNLLEYGDIKIDLSTREATLQGKSVVLGQLECGITEVFVRENESLISHSRLLDQFGRNTQSSERSRSNALRMAISRLKTKFPGYIRTERTGNKVEYRFETPSKDQS